MRVKKKQKTKKQSYLQDKNVELNKQLREARKQLFNLWHESFQG